MSNLTVTSEELALAAAVNDRHKARIKQLGRVLALSGITLSSIVPLAALASLTSHVVSNSFGIPLLTFYNANFGATPALIMLFCYAGLLRSLFIGTSSKAASIGRVILMVIIFLLCAATGPVSLFYFSAGLFAWFFSCGLGRAIRAALPESFRFDRALASLAVGSLPSLAYMAAINLGIIQPHSPVAGMTAHFSPMYLLSVGVVLTFSFGLQGLLLAKSARTGQAGPLVLLSLLVASPIILTGAAIPISAYFCAELTAYTLPLFFASLLISSTGVSASALGAFFGAKSNEASHDFKIEGGSTRIRSGIDS